MNYFTAFVNFFRVCFLCYTQSVCKTQCPVRNSEWMKGYGNSCYKFVQHPSNATNADVECAVMGGHLAWLETAAEQNKFEQLRHKFGKSPGF